MTDQSASKPAKSASRQTKSTSMAIATDPPLPAPLPAGKVAGRKTAEKASRKRGDKLGNQTAKLADANKVKSASKRRAKSTPPSKPVAVEKRRDRFAMPPADYALIAVLKLRAGDAGRKAKKNELLRAGLQALNELVALSLVDALNRLSR